MFDSQLYPLNFCMIKESGSYLFNLKFGAVEKNITSIARRVQFALYIVHKRFFNGSKFSVRKIKISLLSKIRNILKYAF